jgi:hypothetical protein
MSRLLLVPALLLPLQPAAAEDKKDPSKSNLPVELKLNLKKTTFKLEVDGKELKKQIEAAKESGRPPAPPVIDATLEVVNRSDKEVQVWHKGDPVVISFELKGPGVVTHKPMLFFTADFRGPEAVKVAPGKSYSIPVTSLVGGFRGASEYTYWAEPGDYELTAILKTGISPAPEGLKKDESGFAPVPIRSGTVKLKVEGK